MVSKPRRRRNKERHAVRKTFLIFEVLVIALVFIGGSTVTRGYQEKRKEEIKEYIASAEAVEEPAVTPVPDATSIPARKFDWKNYKIIAHALGGISDTPYLNSKESFISYYEKGVRLFEVDLTRTSDGVWVCRHSWNSSLGQWSGDEKNVMSSEEFLSTPLYGLYTPMSLKDLMVLLKDYPDAFVMLDSKQYSVRNYQRTLEDYIEYMEIAKEAGAESVLDQIIPQIYNEAMFPGTALMHQFPSYIYSLWQKYSTRELKEIASYCKEKGIPAATIHEQYWSEKIQKIFDDKGIKLFVYTVNDKEKAREYMKKGVAGICTDKLLAEDIMQ